MKTRTKIVTHRDYKISQIITDTFNTFFCNIVKTLNIGHNENIICDASNKGTRF